jgi:hypothetical protein
MRKISFKKRIKTFRKRIKRRNKNTANDNVSVGSYDLRCALSKVKLLFYSKENNYFLLERKLFLSLNLTDN